METGARRCDRAWQCDRARLRRCERSSCLSLVITNTNTSGTLTVPSPSCDHTVTRESHEVKHVEEKTTNKKINNTQIPNNTKSHLRESDNERTALKKKTDKTNKTCLPNTVDANEWLAGEGSGANERLATGKTQSKYIYTKLGGYHTR